MCLFLKLLKSQSDVKYLLTISTEDKSFKNILKIVEKFIRIRHLRIHPHEAKKYKKIKS